MYAVVTKEMIDAMGFGFLSALPVIFTWAALAAWALAFGALVYELIVRIAR